MSSKALSPMIPREVSHKPRSARGEASPPWAAHGEASPPRSARGEASPPRSARNDASPPRLARGWDPDPLGGIWEEVFREFQGLVTMTFALAKEEPLASARILSATLLAAVTDCGNAVVAARRTARSGSTEAVTRALGALRRYCRMVFIARRGGHITKAMHSALDAQAQAVEMPLRLLQAELLLGEDEPLPPPKRRGGRL